MAIKFESNYDFDGHYHSEGYVCSCSNIGHIISVNYFDDDPESGFTFEFSYSPYRAWYQRIWDAVKYVFHPMSSIKFDSTILHLNDARSLHRLLGDYLETVNEKD